MLLLAAALAQPPDPEPSEEETTEAPQTEQPVLHGVLASAPGARLVHWSMVTPVKQCAPKMPEAAASLGLEGSCRVRLFVDESGDVSDHRFEDCPDVFTDAVSECMKKTSFEPMEFDGEPTEIQFVIKYEFKLEE